MTEVVQVLLADDEKEFVETLAARLEVRGMKVHTALSGDEALSRIKENGIDVVILDVLMPGRNPDIEGNQGNQPPAPGFDAHRARNDSDRNRRHETRRL